MQKTAIGWADYSSNPLYSVDRATGKRGWYCTKVSRGCRNCYAETLNLRFGNGIAYTAKAGAAAGIEMRLNEKELAALLRLKPATPGGGAKGGPARDRYGIFLCDMTDIFHEAVPLEMVLRIFETIEATPAHDYMLLTKRPRRALQFCRTYGIGSTNRWPTNAWLGVSVENQQTADERIPLLLETPAAVRFVSYEPALGPITLFPYWTDGKGEPFGYGKLDWVIFGGESGAHRRTRTAEQIAELHDWAAAARAQCRTAGVAWFGKQTAAARPGQPLPDDERGLNDHEWPPVAAAPTHSTAVEVPA